MLERGVVLPLIAFPATALIGGCVAARILDITSSSGWRAVVIVIPLMTMSAVCCRVGLDYYNTVAAQERQDQAAAEAAGVQLFHDTPDAMTYLRQRVTGTDTATPSLPPVGNVIVAGLEVGLFAFAIWLMIRCVTETPEIVEPLHRERVQ